MSWQDFLLTHGATPDADGFARFDNKAALAALADGACLMPLQDFGLIRFSGEETIPFLHGQLSSDVKKLGADAAQFSCYSTPKGRMLTSLLLLRDADDLLLMLPASLLAGMQKRLSMYVLRSKTRASDASQAQRLLGLAGPKALALAEQVFGRLPAQDLESLDVTGGRITRLPVDRLLLNLDHEQAGLAWQKLVAAGAVPGNDALWRLGDIRAGIVWVQPETQEEFVAQMANMDLIGAVNFKKGCYPGQEIVARTQYLGKLKRRTFRVCGNTPLQAGQPVYSPEMNGQACGQIALAAQTGDDGWEALAVVQLSSLPHGLHLDSPQGPSLAVLPLPYTVHE